jgi:hypothetical protein
LATYARECLDWPRFSFQQENGASGKFCLRLLEQRFEKATHGILHMRNNSRLKRLQPLPICRRKGYRVEGKAMNEKWLEEDPK